MSCSDILLSFLADVGEDCDSFIFPESDNLLINIDEYINSGDYVDSLECQRTASDATTVSVSSASVSYFDSFPSSDAEDKFFQDSLDMFEFTDDDFSEGLSADSMFHEVDFSASMTNDVCEVNSRKRKMADEQVVVIQPSAVSQQDIKKTKISVNEQIRDVCGLLRQYKVIKDAELLKKKLQSTRRYRFSNPVGSAEAYLNSIFGSSAVTPQALLKLASPTSTFQCKALSSLVDQSNSKKTQMKLAAWAPVNPKQIAFPESHVGIGQVAAASRAFVSSMAEILSHSVLSKLKSSVHIPSHSAILSKYGDQLSAPFHWKSEGMIAMGYPEELEFNGLIRCSFVPEGVASASVSFDACKIIRHQSEMVLPQVVSAGLI